MSNLLVTVGGAALLINGGLATIPTTYEGTVTVNVTRSYVEVAPEIFFFEVTGYSGFDTPAPSGTFDERWHDYAYLWNFGDTGATYTIPTRLPTAHKNSNVGYGPAVAHTYKTPGTYNVSCLVIELSSGKQALYEYTAVVKDPDVVFAGKTITVGPTGRDYTDPLAAFDAADLADDLRRIVLDRDQTYDISAGYQWRHSKTFKNVYVCAADGAGAKPILYAPTSALTAPYNGNVFAGIQGMNYITNSVSGENELDFVWVNIHFKGNWDAATETGNPLDFFDHSAGGALQVAGQRDAPRYWLLHGCEFDGVSKLTHGGGAYMGISDCHVTNWQDYGMFYGGLCTAILGTKIEQKLTALGGGPKDGSHNNHGPVRGDFNPLIIDGSEFYSTNGWVINNTGYNTQQPCLRLNPTGPEGYKANIQRSLFEGGFQVLDITRENTDTYQADMNLLLEKNYILGTHMTVMGVEVQYGGTTLRNNIIVRPNTPVISGTFNFQAFVRIVSTAMSTGDELARILIEHNQFAYLLGGVNGGSSRAGFEVKTDTNNVTPTNLIVRHNVLHEPNLGNPAGTSANVPFAPVDATPLFTPYCDGYRRRRELWIGDFGVDTPTDWNYGDTLVLNYSDGNINDGPNASSWEVDGAHFFTEEPLTGSEWNSVGGPDANFSLSFGATSLTITNLAGKDEYFSGSTASDFPNGGTIDIPYSNGYYASVNGGSNLGDDTKYVGAAGNNRYLANNANTAVYVEYPDIAFEFFPTFVRLTNNGATIVGKNGATYKVYLERNPANYVPRVNNRGFRLEVERAVTDLPAVMSNLATPADSAALYRQEVTSAAIDAGGTAYDDYFGTVRTGPKDAGAFEGTG